MAWDLNVVEARVLGCLIEKQVATPEVYPLTLNSLTLACNQRSNRAPMMSLAHLVGGPIPAEVPYLRAPSPPTVALPPGGDPSALRVGLVWAGNVNIAVRIPKVEANLPVFRRRGSARPYGPRRLRSG